MIPAKKILWSVNVLDGPELQDHALFLLGALTRSSPAEVIPVFILDRTRGLVAGERLDFTDALMALAEKRMAELALKSDVKGMSKGKILEITSSSTKAQVQMLIDFATDENADTIVVSSHARRGVPRWFMGSFAETLVLNSTIPVLTVNPETKVRERISKILFPTVFPPEFRTTFEKVVKMAANLDAKLTLYYKEPLIPSPFMSPEIYAYIEKEAIERSKDAMRWQEWAIKEGVPTEIHLDNHPGYVDAAIENYAADKNMDLVVMVETVPDELSCLIAGSCTRHVVRQSPCPVLVLRAEPNARS